MRDYLNPPTSYEPGSGGLLGDLGGGYTSTPGSGGGGLTTVTVNAPLTGEGTSGTPLSLPAASSSTSGYLSSTHWSMFDAKENALGNPGTNGYVLASTTAGVRSWVPMSAGISAHASTHLVGGSDSVFPAPGAGFFSYTGGTYAWEALAWADMPGVAQDKILGRYNAGTGTVEEIACTPFARSILDDVDAAAVRATLGVGTASHVHAISDVTGLQTALDGKQASLGFTPYNATNPSNFIALASAITGYTAGANTALAATDTLLAALGKVQGQITARVSFPGFGTTGTTACVGNDSRLSDARTPTAHNQALTTITTAIAAGTLLKSDGTNAVASTITEAIVNANTAKVSFPGFGATAALACVGNDARLSDARTPLSHAHGNITNAGAIGTTADLPIKTTASGVLAAGAWGTAAGTFCQGNDARLSDARTPLSHALTGHTASGLTAGHFLKALSATTFGFAAHGLTYTDVGAAASGHTHTGTYEPALGNPGTNGYVLASTTAGVRSWVAMGSGGSVAWGGITGDIEDQSDLQTALSGKEASFGNPGTSGYLLASTSTGTRYWVAPGGSVAWGGITGTSPQSSPAGGWTGEATFYANTTVSYTAAGNVSSIVANLSTAANSNAQFVATNDAGRNLRIQKSSSSASSVTLAGGPTGEVGAIFTDSAHPLLFGTNAVTRFWLDASTGAATFAGEVSIMGASTSLGRNWASRPAVVINTDGVMEVGKYIDFHESSSDGVDFSSRLWSNGGVLTTSAAVSMGALTATTGSFSGDITLSGKDQPKLKLSTSGYTTSNAHIELGDSTNGIIYFGRENSAGTAFGATPYAGVAYTTGSKPFQILTNGSVRFTIDGSTGAVSVSDILTVADRLNCSNAGQFDINSKPGTTAGIRINRLGGTGGFQVFQGSTTNLNFFVSDDGNASLRGDLALGSPLTVGSGGTGSTSAAAARTALGVEAALGNPGTDGYVLSSTAAGVRAWAHASIFDQWTYVKLTSDFSTSSATAVDVTGLSFTPAINSTYEVEGTFLLRTATATVGPRPGLAWPTNCTDGVASMWVTSSATAQLITNGNISAALLTAVGGLPTTTGSFPGFIQSTFVTGAGTSGNWRVQIASETAGTLVTMKAGSWIRYRKLP